MTLEMKCVGALGLAANPSPLRLYLKLLSDGVSTLMLDNSPPGGTKNEAKAPA